MRNFYYNKLSPAQRHVGKACVDYVIDKYLPRLKNKISVRVIGKKDLRLDEDILADCAQHFEDDSPVPREFVIRIDTSQSLKNFFRTLSHELIHVKQLAKGEMRYSLRENGKVYWYKKLMSILDESSYYDQPWEIEAHGREMSVMIGVLQKYPLVSKKYFLDFDPTDVYND